MSLEPNAVVIRRSRYVWEVWSGGSSAAWDRDAERGTFKTRDDAEMFAEQINDEDTE